MAKPRHGMSNTKIHQAWSSMRMRCHAKTHKAYKNYGGRGIFVCDRWEVFENFMEDMGLPLPGQSLDRIDNDKGYCKENCRWATAKEQLRNTRANHYITFEGQKRTKVEWAELYGINWWTLKDRLNRGWPVKAALGLEPFKRVKKNARLVTYKNETKSVAEWAKFFGINYYTLIERLDKKRPLEEAFGLTPLTKPAKRGQKR